MSPATISSRLYVERDSLVHRLPAPCKLVAAFGFVLAVVSTPREQFWAFGVHAGLLAAVALAASVPAPTIARRALVETPFVAFAVLLPFLVPGEQIRLLGIGLSEPGLLGAWNIMAKATLGVVAAVLLAATTRPQALVAGLSRLRLPSLVVQIMSLMVRYLDVIAAEQARMRIARESRGFVARDVRQLGVLGRSAAALFVRSYERGERVHLAMLSRGYAGTMPAPGSPHADAPQWLFSLTVPAAAAATAVLAWGVS